MSEASTPKYKVETSVGTTTVSRNRRLAKHTRRHGFLATPDTTPAEVDILSLFDKRRQYGAIPPIAKERSSDGTLEKRAPKIRLWILPKLECLMEIFIVSMQ